MYKVSLVFLGFQMIFRAELLIAQSIRLKYEELPDLIAGSNLVVMAAKQFFESSVSMLGYAERASLPQIDAESGIKGSKKAEGTGASAPFLKVEASVPLYREKRYELKDALQDQEILMKKAEVQLAFMSQLSLAREWYIRLSSVREQKVALENARKGNDRKMRAARIKTEAGLSTDTDILEIDLHNSTLAREKRMLDKEDHELSNKIQIILGMAQEIDFTLDKTFTHPPGFKESNYKFSARSHPLVQKLLYKSAQAKLYHDAVYPKWRPDVSLFASYEGTLQGVGGTPNTFPTRELATGIRLSLPLGDRSNQRAEAFSKRLESSAYDLQSQQAVKELEKAFHEYLHDMRVLNDLIDDAGSQLVKAKRYLQQTSAEYQKGIKNGPDVLEASRLVYNTEKEYINLILEYYLAEVGISNLQPAKQ